MVAVTQLASPRRNPQTPYSQYAHAICQEHHDSARQSDCHVGQDMGTAEEQVWVTAGPRWMTWERAFDLLLGRKNPMATGQLDVPHHWYQRCSSLFCCSPEHAEQLVSALRA